MADRFPLVVASGSVQELPSGDSLDLSESSIKNATFVGVATFSNVSVASSVTVATPGNSGTSGVFWGRVGINTSTPASALSVSRRTGITSASGMYRTPILTIGCETLKDSAGLTTARNPSTGLPVRHQFLTVLETIASSAGIETSAAQQAGIEHAMSRAFVRPGAATSIFCPTQYGQMIIVAGIGTQGTAPAQPNFTDIILTGYSNNTVVTVIGKNEGGGSTPSGRIYTIVPGFDQEESQDPSGGNLRVSIGATGSPSGYNVVCYAITASAGFPIPGRDFA